MSKRALLVGINNFKPGIPRLRGCINDTLEMQSILKTYYGFRDADIKILHNKAATAQGIRDGLEWLLSDYGTKDVRIFHFSSHGTQVDDQSNDEWECLDEVIVPYDHDWDKPFRDDDLSLIFDRIPPKVNFTFIADCCHSGTIQKALFDSGVKFRARYLAPPPEIAERIERKVAKRNAEAYAWAREDLVALLTNTPQDQWDTKVETYIDQLINRYRQNKFAIVKAKRNVLLAACEDRQTAADARIEGEYRGAFTWALAKAIKDSNGDLTYAELIARAGANLKQYDQKPQLECPSKLRNLRVFAPLG